MIQFTKDPIEKELQNFVQSFISIFCLKITLLKTAVDISHKKCENWCTRFFTKISLYKTFFLHNVTNKCLEYYIQITLMFHINRYLFSSKDYNALSLRIKLKKLDFGIIKQNSFVNILKNATFCTRFSLFY